MAKRVSISLIIALHLFLFGTTLTYAKTDTNHKYPQPLTFFMHDILGGSTPSERIVNGIIINTQTINLPFSKPNNKLFPIKGTIPIPIIDTSIGSPTTTTVIKNIDKNKVVIESNSLPYVTRNKLPLGATTLENLLFGRITVIDDEITKGYELGSEVIGKAQGFHLVSSLDGSSLTMAFTTLFFDHEGYEDGAISFFGVHRRATSESCIVVVGGTGKYENVRGYAKIETVYLPDQHPTNGVEQLFQITVYLS